MAYARRCGRTQNIEMEVEPVAVKPEWNETRVEVSGFLYNECILDNKYNTGPKAGTG